MTMPIITRLRNYYNIYHNQNKYSPVDATWLADISGSVTQIRLKIGRNSLDVLICKLINKKWFARPTFRKKKKNWRKKMIFKNVSKPLPYILYLLYWYNWSMIDFTAFTAMITIVIVIITSILCMSTRSISMWWSKVIENQQKYYQFV